MDNIVTDLKNNIEANNDKFNKNNNEPSLNLSRKNNIIRNIFLILKFHFFAFKKCIFS